MGRSGEVALGLLALFALGCGTAQALTCDGGTPSRVQGVAVCVYPDAGPERDAGLDAGGSEEDAGPEPDAGSDGGPDAGSDGGPDAGTDAGLAGEIEEAPEYPDCIPVDPEFCTNFGDYLRMDLRTDADQTVSGRIDSEAHRIYFPSCDSWAMLPDRDVLRVYAPEASLVEVTVERQRPAGVLEPVLQTFDHQIWPGRLLTFAYGPSGTTRTELFAPSPGGGYWTLRLFDARNYALEECTTMAGVGGEGYGYTVRARILPDTPTDLGALGEVGSTPLTASGALDLQGRMRVYRFTPSAGVEPVVRVTATACPAGGCELVVVPVGDASRLGNPFRSSAGTSDEQDWRDVTVTGPEYRFVVFDYGGGGGGGYTYDVSVRAEAP